MTPALCIVALAALLLAAPCAWRRLRAWRTRRAAAAAEAATCARSDRWCPQPSIIGRTVVSAPGAAIRTEIVHLSPEMRARLELTPEAAAAFRRMRPTKGP